MTPKNETLQVYITNSIIKKIDSQIALGLKEDQYLLHYFNYRSSEQVALNTHYSFGLPPDHIVQLPIDSIITPFSGKPVDNTKLNVEAMLKRANLIATSDEKFSLKNTNCSKVAGRVLLAGTQGNKAGKVFDREALNTYATPQMVFNNSLKYLRSTSKMIDAQYHLKNKSDLVQSNDEHMQQTKPITGFQQINFSKGTDIKAITKEHCIALFNEFENSLDTKDELPYLTSITKINVERKIKGDSDLEKRFYDLCNRALMKANQLNPINNEIKVNEWEIVKGLMASATYEKIDKKDHPNLSYSYIVLDLDGEKKPYRVSHDILGKGAEGKVKVIENEQGERLAMKVIANKVSLDNEIIIMKKVNAVKSDFVRERNPKFSKTMQKEIGDKRYIIQPLYKGVELSKLLSDDNLTPKQKMDLALKCCEAVKNLHDRNILHRDIKGSNFMAYVDEKGNVTVNIIDFGGAIKTTKTGKKDEKPFGSPRYMAPELGQKEIIAEGGKWQDQKQIAINNGNLACQAKNHIDYLDKEIKSTKGEFSNITSQLLHNNNGYFKKKDYAQIKLLLDSDKGDNREHILTEILKLTKSPASVNEAIKQYFSYKSQLNTLENNKLFFESKMDDYLQKQDQAQKLADKFYDNVTALFQRTVSNSFASDVYALGVMFQYEFKLDMVNPIYAQMLANDPSSRPTTENLILDLKNPTRRKTKTVTTKSVEAKTEDLSENTSKLEGRMRVPSPVVANNLHVTKNRNLSILSSEEMKELSDIRAEKKNSYMQIKGKTVFISEQGGAFAMHSPISTNGAISSYLVQNLDDSSWAVMRMVQGNQKKIASEANQLKTENTALSDLKKLTGTLEIKQNDTAMHINIQPYAYGKSYEEVLKSAKSDDHGLTIENLVLMSLRALEALAILHDKHQYLHRDITPQKIIWDDTNNTCTLSDFSRARRGTSENLEINDATKRGNPVYQAPEIEFNIGFKEDRKYTMKTDLFSIGVVIGDLLAATKQTNHPAYQQLIKLQNSLIADDPKNRPTTREALQQLNAIQQSLAAKVDQQQKSEPVGRSNVQSNPTINTTILLTQALLAHTVHITQVDTKSVIATLQEETHYHDKIKEKSLPENKSVTLEDSGTESKPISKKSSDDMKKKEEESDEGEKERESHPKV